MLYKKLKKNYFKYSLAKHKFNNLIKYLKSYKTHVIVPIHPTLYIVYIGKTAQIFNTFINIIGRDIYAQH